MRLSLALAVALSLAPLTACEGGKSEAEPNLVDNDGDGYAAEIDCDDADPARSPGAEERCNDMDDDCDGEADELGVVDGQTWHADQDGDGVGSDAVTALACLQPEGWLAEGGDCDDLRPEVGPGQPETCDGLDDDCDGEVDEPGATDGMPGYWDGDQDSFGDPETSAPVCAFTEDWVANRLDCDDTDPTVFSGAPEYCDDIDNDCDGEVDIDALDGNTYYRDADGDNYGDSEDTMVACSRPSGYSATARDCDDTSASVKPTAAERCDGVDNDCDGTVDADATDDEKWLQDGDGDGYGDDDSATWSCDDPYGDGVHTGGDCDDDDAEVHPGVEEIWYDGIDQDCAQDSDWDADGDGYVTAELEDEDEPTVDPGTGEVIDDGADTAGGDCDDGDPDIHPDQEETCDGLDQDCDDLVDEDATDTERWYPDEDEDGYGVSDGRVYACAAPGRSWSARGGDCDDEDGEVHPGVEEIWYDGLDQDCREDSDWDADADGYVTADLEDEDQPTYDPGTGEVIDDGADTEGGDCDDDRASTHPGASERCDGVDQDCDGEADEGATDAETWYLDEDGDGYGSELDAIASCDRPSSAYITTGDDCDDSDMEVNPDAEEIWYDGWDQDCGEDSDWDQDGDNYVTSDLEDENERTYDPGTGEVVDSGSSTRGGDCDDEDVSVRPGITERCDGVDNDCDGEVDSDAPTADTYYLDEDGDGYGLDETADTRCSAPGAGYTDDGGDCDDGDAAVNPGEDEICGGTDGLDNDCDGHTDLACDTGWVRYTHGSSDDPTEFECDLYWDTTWALSAETCDDCDWTFEVTLTYDADASDNTGGCVDEGDADLSWVFGLAEYVRRVDKLYQLGDDGSWTAWDDAVLDSSTGRLSFNDGTWLDDIGVTYETDYWQGSAELYELTR